MPHCRLIRRGREPALKNRVCVGAALHLVAQNGAALGLNLIKRITLSCAECHQQ
jgi:hypothetical protein